MRDTINQLIALQETDQKVAALGAELEELARATEEAEKTVAAAKAGFDAEHQRTQEARAKVHRLEMDTTERETGIANTTQALNKASNNKEYSGLLMKIATLKAEIGKLEEETLLCMDEVEAREADEKVAQGVVSAAEGKLREAEQAREARRADLETQLAETVKEREGMAAELPDKPRKLYERIRSGNMSSGTAVAEVHDEYCQACQIRITPHQLTQLVSASELVMCGACQRILVYNP